MRKPQRIPQPVPQPLTITVPAEFAECQDAFKLGVLRAVEQSKVPANFISQKMRTAYAAAFAAGTAARAFQKGATR